MATATPRPGRVTVEQWVPDDLSFHRPDWHLQAACRGYIAAGRDIFFPSNDARGKRHIVAEARNVCSGCPVKTECLEYAMSQARSLPGIWGGLSGNERRRLRERRAA